MSEHERLGRAGCYVRLPDRFAPRGMQTLCGEPAAQPTTGMDQFFARVLQ